MAGEEIWICGRWNRIFSFSLIVVLCIRQFTWVTPTDSIGNDSLLLAPASTSKETIINPTSGTIWITTLRFKEGIAGWRRALAEVIVLAKQLNATLVEPQISNGRLQQEGVIPLSDVYNRTLLTNYYPKIATLQEFHQAIEQNNPQTFQFCLQDPKKQDGLCQQKLSSIQTEVGPRYSKSIRKARKASAKGQMVVLELDNIWKQMLIRFEDPETSEKFVQEDQLETALRHFKFHSKLYTVANQALAKMNISDYAVVHWRGEELQIDYLDCAQRILETKAAMSHHQPTMPFLLMSSLSLDSRLEWWGARKNARNTTAHQALALLLHNDTFQKLDSVLPRMEDMVLYSVVDWIVAQKATSYSTCRHRCDRFCLECNYGGKFALASLELREEVGRESWPCWPKRHHH